MRRLLTGLSHNRHHNRSGPLFQNRYKSILCQEDPYLLDLVRYIHLNPMRAGIVSDMNQLDTYPFSGHGVLIGKQKNEWQDTDDVLVRFAKQTSEARYRYRQFVEKGIVFGQRSYLIGGKLVGRTGEWYAVKPLRRENALAIREHTVIGKNFNISKLT
jgi:hypothetical protein